MLSGAGNMSSYPHDTMCLPPSKQEGDPGPPSKSNSLKGGNGESQRHQDYPFGQENKSPPNHLKEKKTGTVLHRYYTSEMIITT